MKVVFLGTPEFALPSFQAIQASGRHEIVLVVTKPDKPSGRGNQMTVPPVGEAAQRCNIPVEQPKSLKGPQVKGMLQRLRPDAAVVVAYGKLIPDYLLGIPKHGFVNVHPSLLPRHRGASPIQWSLVSGDRVTGVTTMMLDAGMDTGPILLQRSVEILPKDDAESLSERLAQEGASLLIETLDGLEAGTVEPKPQSDEGANVSPVLKRNFGKIDWTMPSRQLVNRLRGFTPWPGLYAKYRGGRIKIHGLEVVEVEGGAEEPGTVISTSPAGIVVRCGRGTAAVITELQREGRRRLPADAFLIGERVVRGERFG